MSLLKRKKIKTPAVRKVRGGPPATPRKLGLHGGRGKTEAFKTTPHQKKRQVSPRSQTFRVLKQPRVTEKGTSLQALNQYIFEVNLKANKNEVKKAIEELYGVKVVKVNIINFMGKQRRYGRIQGRTRAWKKAIITLRQGDTIKLFEGV